MKKYSVLFVDDEMIIRETLGADLAKMGYKVKLAENGEEAIKLIKKNRGYNKFDMVITNFMMTGINGMEVLKEVRKNSSDTLVILLTGYGGLETVINSIRLHVDDYILKPCKSKDLQFRIKRCFERYELKKKLKLYEDMLKVCCVCNKIKEEKEGKEKWVDWGDYISNKGHVTITSSYCSECLLDAENEIDSKGS